MSLGSRKAGGFSGVDGKARIPGGGHLPPIPVTAGRCLLLTCLSVRTGLGRGAGGDGELSCHRGRSFVVSLCLGSVRPPLLAVYTRVAFLLCGVGAGGAGRAQVRNKQTEGDVD